MTPVSRAVLLSRFVELEHLRLFVLAARTPHPVRAYLHAFEARNDAVVLTNDDGAVFLRAFDTHGAPSRRSSASCTSCISSSATASPTDSPIASSATSSTARSTSFSTAASGSLSGRASGSAWSRRVVDPLGASGK